jgi:hypothetical protein
LQIHNETKRQNHRIFEANGPEMLVMMKRITNIGVVGLALVLGLGAQAVVSAAEPGEGDLDLDVMELPEDTGDIIDEDTLVIEDEVPIDSGDLYLDDGDVDASVGSTEDDTLVLDDEAGDVGGQSAADLADDDILVLSDDDAEAFDLSETDTLLMDDEDLGESVSTTDDSDEIVLEDAESAPDTAIDSSLAELDEQLDDMVGVSTEDLGPAGEMAAADDTMVLDGGEEDVMVLEGGEEDVMVLEGGEEALPSGVDDMADLDADMAAMMADSVDAADIEAPADASAMGEEVMVLDSGEDMAPGADASLSGLDAEMAEMMAGSDTGADGEGGTLVLDGGGTVEDAAIAGGEEATLAADSVMVMSDTEQEAEMENEALSIYAVLKNESAVFVRSGTPTGSEKSILGGGSHDAGKLYKSEFSLNIYANAQITPDALVHAQINLNYDPKAKPNWYRGPKIYTQYDVLKELYLDTSIPLFDDEGIAMRLGKQQVVWGTADGIKLLDIINPTDFREFVQNTFEDSRIPVWMLNLERNIGDNGNMQLIVAQNRRNRIPGLDQDGEGGQPFIMKGVDSITGSVNGFLNISPAMGKVADAFTRLSAMSGSPIGLTPLSFVTVNDFATNNPVAQSIFGAACSPTFNPATPTSAECLNDITQRPDQTVAPGVVLPGGDNQFVTNLIDGGQWDTSDPNTAFEYMGDATFATFNTFVSAKSRYVRDDPSELSPNLGGRWKSTLGDSFNYSLNYFYSYDSNPSVDMSWQNDAGETLKVKKVRAQQYVDAGILEGIPVGTADRETIILKDSLGRSYGPFDGDPTSAGFGGPGAGTPTLVFTETRKRIHNIGASFDYAMDTASLGSFILRGEFLYQRNVRVPMVNRKELSIGNLTEGLFSDEVNYFKYVLGAETILFTNLTVSAQFIQFINMDFKGNDDLYHANQAVVHLSNNLKKGYKYTNFGSLFLSKPFGAQQDGRVNNIIIAERGGGYWDRLDVEYRFTDALIGTAELNMYFGSEDTMFGQFKESSNFQLGVKYIFE